ncbi:putative basic amino acid antiporter YfcC [Simiduia sp. 21SJ11W-1]|uniref:putative basic amino acid antiporter YfcC n=1 Tax=Simiduia sp. 21SJ11W-1 TaxID=2909669 RepID=UPI0020A0E4DA|nr:putative basic amino acid antiporter YfcC [Simiduia sp. 21SJ11W-1]UTA47719.1 putative basic amino acid antiporter YfcC [Simiduia sp. 21SJ11W-1]
MTHPSTQPTRMPDTWIILGLVALLAYGLTWWVPAGQFTLGDAGLDPDTFVQAAHAQGLPVFAEGGAMGLLNLPFEGLVAGDKWGSAIGVFAFILITGGAFGVIFATGAVEQGLRRVIASQTAGSDWLLPVLFLLFSAGGAVFGMGEEAIPFTLMLAPLMVRMGYDSICALLVTYVATQVGFATSWMNPFGVAIAQGIAGVPLMSGMGLRIGTWCVFTLLGCIWVAWYGRRIRLQPARSLAHRSDDAFRNQSAQLVSERFERGHGLVLLALLAGVAWVIYGVTQRDYYLPEIATQFFTLGLVAAVIGCVLKLSNMTPNSAVAAFREGAAQLLPAAMIVALAKGIVLVLGGDAPDQPSVLNTVLFNASQVVGHLPDWLAAWGMYVFQSVFNFFVTSGSGQAALTMPLMAPLSDLVGVSRQTAVLAFQLGDGLTNILIPTSAALMGCLGAARLDWLVWVKFVWRYFVVMFCLSSTLVIAASMTGY